MRWFATLTLTLALGVMGCSDSEGAGGSGGGGDGGNGSTGPLSQEYLFEIEYVNYAWGSTWVGIVIDRDGIVRAYNRNGEGWGPASDVSFSAGELADKYASEARVVGSLDVDEVQRQFDRVASVDDSFTEPNWGCFDAGRFTYTVFHFDETTERYAPVVLREEGDRARANTSPGAEAVAAWLRDVIGDLEDPGLVPFDWPCLP